MRLEGRGGEGATQERQGGVPGSEGGRCPSGNEFFGEGESRRADSQTSTKRET